MNCSEGRYSFRETREEAGAGIRLQDGLGGGWEATEMEKSMDLGCFRDSINKAC